MQRVRRPWVVLGALALPCLGCAHSPKWEALSKAQLAELASFDMECPKESLELTLVVGRSWNGIGSQAAVTGCAKRSRYVRMEGAGWVSNATAP